MNQVLSKIKELNEGMYGVDNLGGAVPAIEATMVCWIS
jgi:hypothetical protein